MNEDKQNENEGISVRDIIDLGVAMTIIIMIQEFNEENKLR